MRRTVRAHQGETVDALCQRALGATEGVTEQTLADNPGLAALGPELPAGTRVTLPEPPEPAGERRTQPTLQLWS